MQITQEQIKQLNPCKEAYSWYLQNKEADLLKLLFKVNAVNSSWATWLYTSLMQIKQQRQLAVYAAELVLPIFEQRYPADSRPRAAIEAAKAVIKQDTKENRKAAADTAKDAYAAAWGAANVASYAAANAANAASYAAANAANAATKAANTASYAVYAVYAVYAATKAAAYVGDYASNAVNAAKLKIQHKLIKYAVKLLEKE